MVDKIKRGDKAIKEGKGITVYPGDLWKTKSTYILSGDIMENSSGIPLPAKRSGKV